DIGNASCKRLQMVWLPTWPFLLAQLSQFGVASQKLKDTTSRNLPALPVDFSRAVFSIDLATRSCLVHPFGVKHKIKYRSSPTRVVNSTRLITCSAPSGSGPIRRTNGRSTR